jgi:hypothetical protein
MLDHADGGQLLPHLEVVRSSSNRKGYSSSSNTGARPRMLL